MMVRWMCGVSLKDRRRSVCLLGKQSVAGVVRHGRLRWYLEHKSVDDWVLTCRKVEVAGVRCKGKNRKTWKECMDDDICRPSGQFSRVCGGTSYGLMSNPSLA